MRFYVRIYVNTYTRVYVYAYISLALRTANPIIGVPMVRNGFVRTVLLKCFIGPFCFLHCYMHAQALTVLSSAKGPRKNSGNANHQKHEIQTADKHLIYQRFFRL